MITPANGSAPWLEHLLALGIPYIAMLVSPQWTFAGNRTALLRKQPPARIYEMLWRLEWTGQRKPSPSGKWVVFDAHHRGPTEINFLTKPETNI